MADIKRNLQEKINELMGYFPVWLFGDHIYVEKWIFEVGGFSCHDLPHRIKYRMATLFMDGDYNISAQRSCSLLSIIFTSTKSPGFKPIV